MSLLPNGRSPQFQGTVYGQALHRLKAGFDRGSVAFIEWRELRAERGAILPKLYSRPCAATLGVHVSILAHKRLGYVVLVRADSQPLVGIIVGREDSSIWPIQDLMDKTLAFPDSHAMAASLYTRALLSEEHQLKFEPVYVGTHENVYRSVCLGGGCRWRRAVDIKQRTLGIAQATAARVRNAREYRLIR